MWRSLIHLAICGWLLGAWTLFINANEHKRAVQPEKSQNLEGRHEKSRGSGSSLYDLEKSLASKESERIHQLVQALRTQEYEVKGFYHVSTWKDYWKHVISEQLQLLDGLRRFPLKNAPGNQSSYGQYVWDLDHRYASLLNISNHLYMNVAVEADNNASFLEIKTLVDSLSLRHRHKISLHLNRTVPRNSYLFGNRHKRAALQRDEQLSEGEFGTISALTNYCREKHAQGKKAMVYYLHSKGSCCWRDERNSSEPNPVAAWREYMNAMNIEFPSICVRALLKKYSACGTQIQDAHFSGNFWWANCDHIVRLEPLVDRFDFMGAETFVLNGHSNSNVSRFFGYQCGYSTYYCNMNLYLQECSRSSYLPRISRNVFHHQLLPNFVNPDSDNSHVCQHWRTEGRPYYQQAKEIEEFYKIHIRGH